MSSPKEGFKTSFALVEGSHPIHTPQMIIDHLSQPEMKDQYVLLSNGGELSVLGGVGQTGLIVIDQEGRIVAAVKHPKITPKSTEGGVVTFGRQLGTEHIEPMLEVPIGEEAAATFASMQLELLRKGFPFEAISKSMSGAGAIGVEPEAWVIQPETGLLNPLPGDELQKGLLEEQLEPKADPHQFATQKALYTLERAARFPDSLIVDTSVLPTDSPNNIQVNTKGKLGPYVLAIQQFLLENYFTYSDPLAESVMDQLVQSSGFSNHQDLIKKRGTMAHWVMAASHASLGMNHLRDGKSALHTPAEAAIAIADIFNSDLATVAEFLMFSTPIIFNQTPRVNQNWPRDYRSILRHLMDTSHPAPFVGNVAQMYANITHSIMAGLSPTIDRGTYLHQAQNGKKVPVMHGRVRNRAASHEPKSQTGRIEFTGCSNSPSIVDEQARNAFLQVLSVLALEAVEAKQHPVDYFGSKFPHIASWKKQKDLATNAALYGFHHRSVQEVISESLEVLEYAKRQYPSIGHLADIASSRVKNLNMQPVVSLKEYAQNPQGPISEVIMQEIMCGASGLDIAKMIHRYQINSAKKILNQYV